MFQIEVTEQNASKRLASLIKNGAFEIRLESEIRLVVIKNNEMIVTWKDSRDTYFLGGLSGRGSPEAIAKSLIKHEMEAVRLNVK